MVEQPTLTPWASGASVDGSALCLCRDQVKADVARSAGYNLSPVYRYVLYFLACRDGVAGFPRVNHMAKKPLSHACRAGEETKLGV
jgi:hypothetical protein